MITRRQFVGATGSWLALQSMRHPNTAMAQDGLGPFMPHEGAVLTTAWTNAYGPDAESWSRVARVTADGFDIYYSSSRGLSAVRRIRAMDRAGARTLVLGFGPKMPLIMEGTTTLGLSTAVMDDLRSAGQTSLTLIADTSLTEMQGQVALVRQGFRLPMTVGGQTVQVPAIELAGQFGNKRKKASGQFYVLDNRNNPALLSYTLQFKGEKAPRTERVVLVTPGIGERSAMEQSLATVREYTTRGIHFNFDDASIRSSSDELLDQIAVTLRNNPLWTLSITGHTDSIGKDAYNQGLSQRRAESVKAALVARGISPARLATAGLGASQPVASNKTLEGRALNRRVVLARTDR